MKYAIDRKHSINRLKFSLYSSSLKKINPRKQQREESDNDGEEGNV